MYQHLLVAIDRRARSHRVAALALRAACYLEARVTVLFVVATAKPGATGAKPHTHEAMTTGGRVFRHVRQMASIMGVPCVCRYAFGWDVLTIVRDAASTHQCDLIVLTAPEKVEPVPHATD